ncbi:MAG: hypothetical protein SFV15_13660 [Polyangiaceae bacterium]|nr:hypothetical protein [Polyangiaceae bacterium]
MATPGVYLMKACRSRPLYSDVVAFVRERDPLLVEAAQEVDLALLASSLERSVRERLDAASALARTLTDLRRAASREC